jgi:hypothetical protein
MEDMQQNQKPKTLLRIGTITAMAGVLLALIALIIGSQPEPLGNKALPFLAFPLLALSFYVVLGGLAVVVLHYVVSSAPRLRR